MGWSCWEGVATDPEWHFVYVWFLSCLGLRESSQWRVWRSDDHTACLKSCLVSLIRLVQNTPNIILEVGICGFGCRARVLCANLKVVTWLILPVVICLSKRLSHACLSISTLILWNCEWLIKSVIVYLIVPYLDNRSNSRANTCTHVQFILDCIY